MTEVLSRIGCGAGGGGDSSAAFETKHNRMLHLHNDQIGKPAMTGMQGWARRAGAGSGRPDAVSSAVGPCRTMGQRMSRRSTSMSLDAAILDEARQLGINLSQAAESGLVAAIRAERARRWKAENAGAIADFNAFIDASGVPLADRRKF